MTRQIFPLNEAKRSSVALIAALACIAFCAAGSPATGSGPGERWTRAPRSHFVEIVEETCQAVVSIQGEKQYEAGKRSFGADAQYDVFNGMGTGVIVDERGYVVTNYHVVKGLLKLEVVTSDGERYRDVELIRNDVGTDLAVLKIKPKKQLHKIRMGRSERVRLAEDVYAIGNPFGYDSSISRGVVSALNRPLEVNENLSYDRVIQTDAAINPGNSGGPLINVDGEMIGLNCAVREEAENIAFAIPIDVVSDVVERMIRQSAAKMTHHGLKFRVVDSDMPDYPANANGEDCLVVDSVDPHSPAAEAGVQPGDVMVASNGFPLHTTLDFTCSLIGLGLSDTASLEFERAGQSHDATIAFSELSRQDGTMVASAQRKQRRSLSTESNQKYASASISAAFSEEASDADGEVSSAALTSSEPEPGSRLKARSSRAGATQTVWDVLGIEGETVNSDEYRERFPNLQAVVIGDFNFALDGGVAVTRVAPGSMFSSGDVKIQENDLIFGFGVGNEKSGQRSVASVENLYYIAKHLDEYSEVDEGRARVYLIRKGRPYFLEISLTPQ